MLVLRIGIEELLLGGFFVGMLRLMGLYLVNF